MTPAATPVPGGPKSAAPAAGSENGPSTTVRIRPDVAALPTYVPGARPDAAAAAQIAKLSSNELPYPPQDAVVEAITRAATGITCRPNGRRKATGPTTGNNCGYVNNRANMRANPNASPYSRRNTSGHNNV